MKSAADLQSNIIYLGAILVALVIGGYVLIRIIRARMRGSDTPESFTLDDLRAMRASGELTEAEYERMRAMLIGDRPAVRAARRAAPESDDES